MLFATLDVDLGDDIRFVRLEARNPSWPWWYVSRIIQFAKRVNRKGLVLHADGTPVGAEDLAIAHFRDPKRAPEMQDFLDGCLQAGLLVLEGESTYRVPNWRRWHRSPSDEPEQTRDRKAKERDRKRHEGVTTPVTGVTTQSRAEQSIAEHKDENAERFSSPPPVASQPPPPAGGVEGVASLRGEGADGRCAPPQGETTGLRPPGPLSGHALERFAQLRTSGRLSPAEKRRVEGWTRSVHGRSEQAVRWAIEAAVAETLYDGARLEIRDVIAYALNKIEHHLDQALLQVSSNEIRAGLGRPGADYVFRPPEAAA